jgi:hypothetical protein
VWVGGELVLPLPDPVAGAVAAARERLAAALRRDASARACRLRASEAQWRALRRAEGPR